MLKSHRPRYYPVIGDNGDGDDGGDGDGGDGGDGGEKGQSRVSPRFKCYCEIDQEDLCVCVWIALVVMLRRMRAVSERVR